MPARVQGCSVQLRKRRCRGWDAAPLANMWVLKGNIQDSLEGVANNFVHSEHAFDF